VNAGILLVSAVVAVVILRPSAVARNQERMEARANARG
jgi:hypothetical protein